MKAKSLSEMNSESAPDEWKEISEVKAQRPKQLNCEISLQKLCGMNVCVWMTTNGGAWHVASEYFHVKS